MKDLLHSIYNLLPFKKQLFTFLKKFWQPGENIFRHLSFKGVFTVQLKNNRSFKINHFGFIIENEIFWKGLDGGWEKESIGLWQKLCETSHVILDIGANTGVYSLIAKAVNPSSTVYAFEPVKRVFDKLQQNIRLNGFDIMAVEKAVSNSEGTAVIYDPQDEVEQKIFTTTLDSFIRENNLTAIDLIKIDVETHEPEVLEGFSEYLMKFKPTLLIEILDDAIGKKIENIMRDSGYNYYNIDENAGIRKVSSITKSDYFNFLLCPPETAARIGIGHL
jgi:FkbM family methyltransferase